MVMGQARWRRKSSARHLKIPEGRVEKGIENFCDPTRFNQITGCDR